MGNLDFLKQYSGESVEQLLKYEGHFRTDSIVLTFEKAIKAKEARGESLSDEEKVILAVQALERDVNNDGYDGFFRWSSKLAPIVVDALRRIGCQACARITADAIACLRITRPLTAEAIEDEIEKNSEDRDHLLYECDKVYYSNPEDIAGRLFEFIKAQSGRIRFG